MTGEAALAALSAGPAPGMLRLALVPETDATVWAQCVESYEASGGTVAVYHLLEWLQAHRPGRHFLLAAVAPDGICRCLCAATISPTRALPGHRVLWVDRFQGGVEPEAEQMVLGGIAQLAMQQPRLLRAQVRLLHRTDERRRRWGQWLAAAGFARVSQPRGYRATAVLDLQPAEAVIMAGFHATARRHIRAVDKHPVRIAAVADTALGARMEALLEETRRRTGGKFSAEAPARLIASAERYPERIRVLGLFRNDMAGPEALLAFAAGYLHGDHAEYATAASTRRTDLKLALSYGLAWELMRWAKAAGAAWFDFGGITAGTHADAQDRLGGISDFKRYFSRDVLDVADEWVLEPSPVRARLAAFVRSVVLR